MIYMYVVCDVEFLAYCLFLVLLFFVKTPILVVNWGHVIS